MQVLVVLAVLLVAGLLWLLRGGGGSDAPARIVAVAAGLPGTRSVSQLVSSRPRSVRRIRIGYMDPACTPSSAQRSYPWRQRPGSSARASRTARVCADGRRARVMP